MAVSSFAVDDTYGASTAEMEVLSDGASGWCGPSGRVSRKQATRECRRGLCDRRQRREVEEKSGRPVRNARMLSRLVGKEVLGTTAEDRGVTSSLKRNLRRHHVTHLRTNEHTRYWDTTSWRKNGVPSCSMEATKMRRRYRYAASIKLLMSIDCPLRTCWMRCIVRKENGVTTLTSKTSFRCPGLRLKYR